MFLRATKRFKDGKVHYYWSMVENVRVGRRVFQRQALYLGELNDSQREEWQRDDRIEAHIFTAFMALCLLQTLRAIAREHAPASRPARSSTSSAR